MKANQMLLYDWFEKGHRRNADAPALWVDGETYSYSFLAFQARSIAQAIDECAKDSAIVGIAADRSLWAYVSLLATLISGRGYVPFRPQDPPIVLNRNFSHLSLRTFVVGPRSQQALAKTLSHSSYKCRVICLGSDGITTKIDWPQGTELILVGTHDRVGPISARRPTEQNELAFVMFTSGTAGQPKAVGVTHANVAAYLRSVTAWCRGGPQARFSQCFDLAFDLSVHDLFVCWSSAACSYVLQENEKFAPTAFIQRHAITHWFSVPSLIAIMRRLGSLKPNSFPSIRQTLFCGEPLVESLARSWDEAAPNSKIHNLYGPTEGTIAITRHRWRRDTRRAAQAIVPIGLPFEGQQALVLDHDRRVVYGSGMGELALAGDQVTEGYIGNDALTQIRFVNVKDDNDNAKRVYLTGDRVRMREELEFIGRIDDQIQLNGYRVEIAEVEEAIRNASRSDAVAVISLPEGTMSATKMVAFVENDDLDLAKIRENCKLNLAAPLIPTAIHAVEQLPYSTNGKINRNALYRIREWK